MIHKSEYELITHSHLADCNMFLVEMFYRPLHLHKELEIILVLKGTGFVTAQRNTFPVHAGDVLLFNSGELHELHCAEEGMLLLVMQISRGFCKRYVPQLRNIRFSSTNIGSCYGQAGPEALRSKLVAAYKAYLTHDASAAFLCMASVNWIFGSILSVVPYEILDQAQISNNAKYEKRIRNLLAYLEEHFREPVRLQDLAEAAGITQCHLSHFFRDHLHITFQEYLCHLRIEAAMYLLKTTDLSVTTIAYECGFSDPKYLKQGFMRILSMTPQQWRSSSAPVAKANLQNNGATMQRILTAEESAFYFALAFPIDEV